jgi:solute carrier family 35, member E1
LECDFYFLSVSPDMSPAGSVLLPQRPCKQLLPLIEAGYVRVKTPPQSAVPFSCTFRAVADVNRFRQRVPALSRASEGASTARLGVCIAFWYFFNIVFNIINKLTLNIFPMPLFISTWQLAASSLFMIFLWVTRLHPTPNLPRGFLRSLLPVAFFHTIGHIAACVSFSILTVSFTHVIKATEPVFTVALSGPLLGVLYPLQVWLSLAPIVAGCFLAAQEEVTFSWPGFNYAMASNIGMVLRGIYSRQCLQGFVDMDGINLFGLISISSLLFCIPTAILLESHLWPQAASAAAQALGSQGSFVQLLLAGGLFYYLYNQLSYMVLNFGVSPVTFSVGNTMKRVAVVVASVAFFKNPVSMLNWLGSAMAIIGTFWYNAARVKQDAR